MPSKEKSEKKVVVPLIVKIIKLKFNLSTFHCEINNNRAYSPVLLAIN